MIRVHVVGGFLGAGKTTLIRALAAKLSAEGERVALITNDQGRSLVDTQLCHASAPLVQEIVGGCFCCRYEDLEAALFAAEAGGATVAIAEAVGSCTDLVATVLAPLADRWPQRFELAPLAIVVDPARVKEMTSGRAHPDLAYLFQKQIEEADVVVLSKADLDAPDMTGAMAIAHPGAAVVRVSGWTGEGLDAWRAARPVRPAAPLTIDYDRYGDAEALLGWCNARLRLSSPTPFSTADVARRFLSRMAELPVAHLKLTGLEPQGGTAAVVGKHVEPTVLFDGVPTHVEQAVWLINARIAVPPESLVAQLKSAMRFAAPGLELTWEELECFRPSAPTPTHRYAFRCGSGDDASCCAAFYDRADVRALLGDSWHPGGVELTLALGARLGLGPDKRVLDVACGAGTSLAALIERFRVLGFGLDKEARAASDETRRIVRGDAHAIPFEDQSFDAILCECALSTFVDQPTALAQMRRVLRPGGRVAISDMAVEGAIPETLRDWVHTGTCLSRALTSDAYVAALEAAGLRLVERWDASDALRELLLRIKKNLVGAAFAAASGNLGGAFKVDMKYAREVLREATRAVDAGTIRYTALIAERADAAPGHVGRSA